MPQDLDSLRDALKDRYAVERELGRGGMATVYLATDLKHHRPVALKVLKPELAAALGPDRFLREIEVTAGLHHPHILPLYDSGRTGGPADRRSGAPAEHTANGQPPTANDLLYYVMPFVEGESLRDRLERERQLPLEEALQLTREVAEALSYAHSRGVIHRDIKPENILLEGGHALVADFGIAKAITSACGSRLTETGLSIGTPAYMSPEQAGGHDHIDARSDLYSLGCVLYEMLAGHPPFQGTTAHELLARHATDPVPPLRTGRTTIPEPIEAAVERVLAKVPADRYATAQQFSAALQIDATAYRRRQRRLGQLRAFGVAVGAAVMIAAAVYGVTRYRSATAWKARPVDLNVVAVFPFRVTSADPAIQTLDEGIGDLFHGQLTGEAGLRAVNPTSLLRAWNGVSRAKRETDPDADLEVATRFGAGQVLEGSIVQAGSQLTLSAWLRRVPGGEETERVTVTGPSDSIAVLQYRLAMQLLGSQLGETTERVESFADRDPRAVMAYLAGIRAYRDGRQQDAHAEWSRAEAMDSGFTLPVLGLARINLPLPGEDFYATLARAIDARRRASGFRGQVSPREQARLVVDSLADPAHPARALDVLAAVQHWADLAPDDVEALYGLIDALWNVGNLAGVPNWRSRLETARLRAWELDSTTARSIQEQVWNAFRHRDGAWLRRVAPTFLRLADSTADMWAGWRWAIALATGDSDRVRELRARATDGDPKLLTRSTAGPLLDGAREGWFSLFDRDLVVREMQAHGIPGFSPAMAYYAARVSEATQWMMMQRHPYWWMFVVELAVVYPGLDSVAGVAADSLGAYLARTPPLAVTDPADSPPAFVYGCVADLHRAWHRDTVGLRARMAALKPLYREVRQADVCPAMVEALLEAAGGAQAATPALDRLERMLRTELTGWDWPAGSGLLLVARVARARGDLVRALKAAGDRGLEWSNLPRNLLHGYLREEAEVAAQLGDTARAIRAFDHYLMLAIDPDPGAMRAQVDSVRAALEALLRARG